MNKVGAISPALSSKGGLAFCAASCSNAVAINKGDRAHWLPFTLLFVSAASTVECQLRSMLAAFWVRLSSSWP
jgi:hypothetical protein